jgi:D-beta-D-heptose 7-phosphate kinase/D-beta-D-heptose 1-phosphate adenosyltransferase
MPKFDFSKANLTKIIKKLKKAKVLVIGDVMLDEYIEGKVLRINPEAPVPVVKITKESHYPGGATNVAHNLAEIGIKTHILGVCGKDKAADKLIELLSVNKIDTSCLFKVDNIPTTLKTRIVAQKQQLIRFDHEEIYRMTTEEFRKIEACLKRLIPKVDAIIVQDYNKGVINQLLVDTVVTLAKKYKKIVTVDPNKYNSINWEGVTALKPNRDEAHASLGLDPETTTWSIDQVGQKLMAKWDMPHLLLTMGGEGMKVFTRGEKPYHVPPHAREVFEVSGAGDTAMAFFTASLAVGFKASIAAEIANLASSIVVGKFGVATVTTEEFVSFHDKSKKIKALISK